MTVKWNRADAIKVRGIIERMNLCGCGTDAHWGIVLELLERAENHDTRGSYYNFLVQPEGNSGALPDSRDSWVEFGGKVLNSWGLVEHGTGIGWAWLTEDGKLLLRFLRDFGIEDCNFEQGTGHPEWSVEFSWTEIPQADDTFSTWESSNGQ